MAAGRGRRLGGETPKQYLPLAGRTSLRLSIEAFLALDRVTQVIPVIHPDDAALFEVAMSHAVDPRLMPPVSGAESRAGSVLCGLAALSDAAPDLVLIHDAARPFVSLESVRSVIDALETSDAVCLGLPIVDAIWQADASGRLQSLPREGLWRAQTPQGFHFEKILGAHRGHSGRAADDVAVAVDAGLDVHFLVGSEQNYKITTASDYARAKADAIRLGLGDEQGN